MSIPLDRLYNYIEHVANKVYGDVVIYRFFPHGSKKIEDLTRLHHIDWYSSMTRPSLICNDQEPLNFDYYDKVVPDDYFTQLQIKHKCYKSKNLIKLTVYDKAVLLHSEQRSEEVTKYENSNFVLAYYWAHALIALDWYRFAQHLQQHKQTRKLFLIYNRSWTGTREYRLKFIELLQANNLLHHCQTSFSQLDIDTNTHYKDFVYKNPVWQIHNTITNSLPPNHASSQSSADFNIRDYEETQIEVVLETLFDDTRLHLTEKSLRPIACGQPFILSSTHGCLQYLKSYGFKTFDSVWDENYDTIQEPLARLTAIVELIKQISAWDEQTKKHKFRLAYEISDYNKKHFFSKEFFEILDTELATNLQGALSTLVETNTCLGWIERRKELCKHKQIKDLITGKVSSPEPVTDIFSATSFKKTEVIKVLQFARQKLFESSLDT